MRQEVTADLDTTNEVKLINDLRHTFLFEVEKKDGDAGMRKSKENYKTVSVKMRMMTFTCRGLQDLAKKFNEYEEQYRV